MLLSASLRQSQELFRKVADAARALGQAAPLQAESALRLEATNGSRIISLPGTESTVRGYSGVDLLVIDEAARVHDELYYSCPPHARGVGGQADRPQHRLGQTRLVLGGVGARAGLGADRVTAEECPRIPAAFLGGGAPHHAPHVV